MTLPESQSESESENIIRDAAGMILAFMKAHRSGDTSVLHVRDGESRPIIIGVFLKYMPDANISILNDATGISHTRPCNSESDKVIALVEDSMGKGAFEEFASSVVWCLRGSVVQYKKEETVTVHLGIISDRTLSCKKENYVRVGSASQAYQYILYTNRNENK